MSIESSKLDQMMSEAPAAINFTVFLNMLADKLLGPEGKGTIPKDYLGDVLTSQADRFTAEELDGMMAAAPIDADGNLDYKGLAYVITHGQEEEVAEEEGEEGGEEEE